MRFEVGSDAGWLRACFDMTLAGWPVDHPDEPAWAYDSFAGKWARGFDGAPQQAWVAADEGGDPVGAYLLQLPDRENTSMAFCTLVVDPARRRAGVGGALLAHCADQARRAGRSRLAGTARDGSPGAAFAAAAGAHDGIEEVLRLLTIDSALPDRLTGLRQAAIRHAGGYTLVSWRQPTPAELLDQVAAVRQAMADAPRDPGVEPCAWDAGRVRESEQAMIDHGLTGYAVAARHDATGELAALTELCTEAATPDWAFQQVTAVLPAHRGHRLGILVKVAMLELLAANDPAVRHIYTGNAATNPHMIAINEQLGFRIAGTSRNWELNLADSADQPPATGRG